MATFTKRNQKWRAQIRRKGINKSAEFRTKADAQRWALMIETQIEAGEYNPIPQMNFGELLDKYAKEISPQKASCRQERYVLLKIARTQLGERIFGDIPLKDLKQQDFEQWQQQRLKEVSAGSVLRERTILSAVLIQAMRWNYLKTNPLKEVEAPKEPAPRTRRYHREEIEKILLVSGYDFDYPPTTKLSRVGAAMLFALETAMRAGEICKMKWEDVNLQKATVFLPHTKNGHARTVPLSTQAIKILRHLAQIQRNDDPTVFQMTSATLGTLFRRLKIKAGLQDANLHFHDTRREAATRLSKVLTVMELAKVTGHRDLSILQNTYYAPDMSEMAQKLG